MILGWWEVSRVFFLPVALLTAVQRSVVVALAPSSTRRVELALFIRVLILAAKASAASVLPFRMRAFFSRRAALISGVMKSGSEDFSVIDLGGKNKLRK